MREYYLDKAEEYEALAYDAVGRCFECQLREDYAGAKMWKKISEDYARKASYYRSLAYSQ
jgi:hypothetical protein